MTVTAIQIGLDPEVIDYSSPDFAQFAGISKEQLRTANQDNVAALRAAGYHVDNCLIDFGDPGADKARRWLEANRYDAVLIGGRRATRREQYAAVRVDRQRRTHHAARLPLRLQSRARGHA